ncbi:histidinol-phosphatase HisJ [Gammaproteobacteria bacterium]|nr:histidinol-phosphatase HisJ [Gammaproteobacteria bacterium]
MASGASANNVASANKAATNIQKVSVHGGHSGQFCHHAKDSLEDVIKAYIDQGFTWVGITEHMAPLSDAFRYPDEAEDQQSAASLREQFFSYFDECQKLKNKYSDQIEIFSAFETESYEGAEAFIIYLVEELKPDYLVGSVHHVNSICIDYDEEHFRQAVTTAGSLEALYLDYFDVQFEMLQALEPAVVGHFDLIRKFDPDYLHTLQNKKIWQRVKRNLDFIARKNLILDFNLRGFDKASEQYPSMPVLKEALAMGIAVVPGDDSHGVASVGRNYDRGIEILRSLGASTDWPKPVLFNHT